MHSTTNNAQNTQQKLGVAFSYIERNIAVVVVVDDDTYYWVYLSPDHLFQVYLQSATAYFITKCDKCYYEVRQVLQSPTILSQTVR